MQSRQINFFHLNSEIEYFIEYFKICRYELFNYKVFNLSDKHFINRNNIQTRLELVNKKYFHEISYYFVEKQNYYLFDASLSSAIEFSFSEELNSEILPGRFYFTPKKFIDGSFFEKDESFVNESMAFYKLFSKEFLVKNAECKSWYVTKTVNELIEKGELMWDESYNSLVKKQKEDK